MINNATHKLLEIVEAQKSHAFQITFKDSEILILKNLYPVDPSVYGSNGLWTAEIVKAIRLLSKKHKLFKPGTGLDFREDDIQEITATNLNSAN